MFDQYPILGGAFPNDGLKAWTSFAIKGIRVAGKDDDSTMPILQMFNWKAFAKKAKKGTRYRSKKTSLSRYQRIEIYVVYFNSTGCKRVGVLFVLSVQDDQS